MVITITGIIAGMVAVFIKSPVDSYIDTARRVALTDVADTAVRRIGRDIRLALPNSVRNPSGGSGQDQCIEFMPTKIGGRYRNALASTAPPGNLLDFSAADDAFDMLWTNSALPANDRIVPGDIVVVYNDGSEKGNAYTGFNAVEVASVCESGALCPAQPAASTLVTFIAATGALFQRKPFPAESPAYRFQVIPKQEHVVAYVCSGGKLYRYGRTLATAYPTPASCPSPPAGTPVLAENVSSCSLKYEPPGSATGPGRSGIVSIALTITQSGESVNLYHQVHVDNTP